MPKAEFIFVVCQQGAESALKSEVANQWPEFRFAFSRPGFVTFKLPGEQELKGDFELRSTFARAYGICWGKLQGDDPLALAAGVWELADKLGDGEQKLDNLHVWERDASAANKRGFEPTLTQLAEQTAQQIVEAGPKRPSTSPLRINRRARAGQAVLDCILVAPDQWWVGYHVAATVASQWPGGIPPIEPCDNMISRAYLKMHEALAWSQLPIEPGDCCVEIGCAPGGSAQALLEIGLDVAGIDPADVDELVRVHPNFVHLKKRVGDLRRREFRGIKWLVSDSNVAPEFTLDSVESIVTYDDVHIRGLILTLKLPNWDLAAQIPDYVERVRSWGFAHVRARQLAFNRQEICIAALRTKSMRRLSRKRPRRK
jgi:23S rRNA (cytidine2498-2'-O)-methyltransferase